MEKSVTYNLGSLFGQAFPSVADKALFKLEGLKDVARNTASNLYNGFKIPEEQNKADINFTDIKILEINEDDFIPIESYLGTPIFQPIIIVQDNYKFLDNGKVSTRKVESFRMPATTTVEFNRSKIIAKTAINGVQGTVKEMWGFSDWEITIRGLIISEARLNGQNHLVYPEDEFNNIKQLETIADSVRVSGGLFNTLDIKRICIERCNFGKIIGMPNVIPFQLSCTSDEALEIIINNNQIQK